jgi:hypothetical protein
LKLLHLSTALALAFALTPSMMSKTKTAKPPDAKPAATQAKPAHIVDLNTATEADLVSLPGVGKPTAKKIIAGRPYSSVNDLSKAGLPPATLEKIRPMVTASGAASAKAAPATPPAFQRSPVSTPTPAARASSVPAAAGSNQVWVNKDTKVFHRRGDRWYGKTKDGEYMNESDALKAGYREAKSKVATK